jgi:spore germination protein YaaH
MPVRRAVATALLGALALTVPPTAAASGQHSAWLPYWSFDRAYRTVAAHADLVGTASPFWYEARSCTAIVGRPGAGSAWAVDGLRARGVAVVPTIASPMTPAAAMRCFGERTRRRAHVARIVRLVREGRFDGIDLDYEHLALTTRPAVAAGVRASFSAFVSELCPRLRRAGKRCVVTVMPRTKDRDGVWRHKLIPAVYDYDAVGRLASTVRVMAYDQHAPNTAAGPIAGYPWVEAVARYALAHVPARRLELGIALYGRDWAHGTATTVTAAHARALAAAHGRRVIHDPVQRAAWFTYTVGRVRHRVWFSDAASVAARVALARRLHLAGAALWAPGQEDPATWEAVRRPRFANSLPSKAANLL